MFKKWGNLLAVWFCLGSIYAVEASDAQAFTGQIKGSRVRMRLHADRDSAIVDELERGQLVAITGVEGEDFYEVLPPKGTRAYVFRTYILENRVEGNRVNVRLQPSLDAPVIAQLNDGDYVQGEVSPLNNKWIEITPPPSTRFYIAKEFVENVGNADFLSKVEKRQEAATHLVNSAYAVAQAELHKPFNEIQLEPALTQFQRVMDEYSDVPHEVARANYYLSIVKDAYLQKKINHLEAKANAASDCFQSHCDEFGQRLKAQQNVLDALEQGIPVDYVPEDEELIVVQEVSLQEPEITAPQIRGRGDANSWVAREALAYEAWKTHHKGSSMDEFYQDQRGHAIHKRGIIQPYTRPVPKKPGNFLLVDPHDHTAVAFLYSTQVDLQPYVGRVVNLKLSKRPNNNFAFPAFYVLSLEE